MFSIEGVIVENFKSFRGLHTFRFPSEPGLYLITGRNEVEPRLGANACGKSTLIDAVYWCLYGKTTRGLKAGDIVSWGEKSAEVTVTVTVGDKTYTISRSQSPNKLTIGNGGVVTQTEVEERLRLGPNGFAYSVMIPQFGDPFFDLAPAAKLTLFSHILGLEYWLERSQEAKALVDQVEDLSNVATRSLSKAKGQVELLLTDIQHLEGLQTTFVADQQARIATQMAAHALLQKRLGEVRFHQTLTHKALKATEAELAFDPILCPRCNQPLPSDDRTEWRHKLEELTVRSRGLERDEVRLTAELGAAAKALDTEKYKPDHYLKLIESAQNRLKQCCQDAERHESEIVNLSKDREALAFWVDGFKRVRLFLVDQTLRQLEIAVNNSLVSLGLADWRVTMDVERENKSGGVTKGFTVNIIPSPTSQPVRWEAFSGGEGQRLRLAGDLGLANLIMNRAGLTNTIEFFDEPSRHLSQEGLLDVAETLHQRALTDGKRIFLIDHNTIDFGNFAGCFLIIKGRDGSRLEVG